MHVCFLSSYYPQLCGIATYTHYLSEAICSLDADCKVTILAEEPLEAHAHSALCVIGSFDRDGDYAKNIISKLKKLAPDVLHIQHEYGIFGYDQRFINLLAELRELQIPTVITLHTVHSRLSFFTGCTRPHLRRMLKKVDIENYQRKIGELADLVIVHQENTIRNILVRQGIPSRNLLTVPHGTMLREKLSVENAKKMLGIDTNTFLVTAFGYFEPSKNFHVLIEAFNRLRKKIPFVKLWLGGHIRYPAPETLRYKHRCLKMIESNGLTEDVIFANEALSENELTSLIAATDVACFVYNEDTHSSSGALHLAMGQGKAVIASRISKFQELSEVSDEILVNPHAVSELTALLKRLVLDDVFSSYVKERIRAYANKTAWPVVAREHVKSYQQLLVSA